MTRIRALDPRVLDGGAAALCTAAMLVELDHSDKSGLTAAAVAAVVVASSPVLLRHRRPVTAYVVALVTLFGVLDTSGIYQTIALPAVLCGYALAHRHGRRPAVWTAALTVPLVLAMLHIYSPHPLIAWDTARNLALVFLPLTFGVAAHERRAHLDGLLERAETAERTREEETLRRIGEERLRIARDVHDVVAHAMVAINVQAGVGAHLLDKDRDRAHAALLDIKRVSGEALTDLRATLGTLRTSEEPEDAPVHPTLSMRQLGDLGSSLRASGVTLDLDIAPDVATLPSSVDATGYRIIQEALTNVLRHSSTTQAAVTVRRNTDHVVINVDNSAAGGLGRAGRAEQPSNGSGLGLRGMRERAQAAGGTLEAGPRPDGGWRVRATIPVAAQP